MGKVLVTARMENLQDLYEVSLGLRTADQVRTVEVTDALVDTGATMLSLPKRYIQQLGLITMRNRKARTAAGIQEFAVFTTVQLTIDGRDCRLDVGEVPDDCPVQVGRLPLHQLDFVVDQANQRLIGNPEHGGQQMIELF